MYRVCSSRPRARGRRLVLGGLQVLPVLRGVVGLGLVDGEADVDVDGRCAVPVSARMAVGGGMLVGAGVLGVGWSVGREGSVVVDAAALHR